MSEQCMSVKNKSSTLQCPNRRKPGSDYCGVHRRSKNVIRIDTLTKSTPANLTPVKKSKEKHTLKSIKKLIIEEGLQDLINVKGKKKKDLLKEIDYHRKRMQGYQDNHEKKIVKIQAALRSWKVQRRSRCVNDCDLCTYQPLTEIPAKYFFSFQDKKGYWYGFDVRTFNGILKSTPTNETPINPYTKNPIPSEVVFKFIRHLKKLSENGVETSYGAPKLTSKQKMRSKMLETFQRIDMLDNYTDYLWFKNLNQSKLRRLYLQMQDLWNYRCQMSHNQKKRIVRNGRVFDRSSAFLKKKSLESLRHLILDEFNRMLTEGVDIAERKLGAMLVLTGLVQVSKEAAQALPQYVQAP